MVMVDGGGGVLYVCSMLSLNVVYSTRSYIYGGNKLKWHCQSKLEMAFLPLTTLEMCNAHNNYCTSTISSSSSKTNNNNNDQKQQRVEWRGHDRIARVSACSFDFSSIQWICKDDWNVMHVAARHSATWRNTYQPQILPYILNIVTLTAIAYSSKRIYWHRARFAWKCWLLNANTHTRAHIHTVHVRCTDEHVLSTTQANLQPSSLGRRLKSFAHSQHFEMGLSEKWSKKQQH